MTKKRASLEVHPQHDEHCKVFDDWQWDKWRERMRSNLNNHPVGPIGDIIEHVDDDRYVIAQSDSIEHLYWSNDDGFGSLDQATKFTRDELTEYGSEPVVDGFWMPLERALELAR
jgi:hypothetical protein